MVPRRLPQTSQFKRSALGQGLVETAILLPILLILLLGAIDFGRAFFGYVNLHQAVRVAANFGAMNPNMTPTERDRYVELVEADANSINCELEAPIPNPSYTTTGGAPTAAPTLGDYATVTLGCDFSPLTPLMDSLFGDPMSMSATSTFPVRQGCINCPTPPPATPPPPPVQCFLVPDMVGMSVAGARLAWASAGFDPDNFTLASGDETSTVSGATPDEGEAISNCDFPTYALFSSSVVVTTFAAEECAAGFAVVPNTIGISVTEARAEWGASGFDPLLFQADGADPDLIDNARIVVSQATDPPSDPGVSCLDTLTTSINVVTGEPWPAPPPTPCEVPSMINHSRDVGEGLWVDAGFSVDNFSPRTGKFTIRSQSLVGGNGAYVTCDASITVSANP